MSTLQRAVERLLLNTGASRAVLHLARPGGGFAIPAEAVRNGWPQIRHISPTTEIHDPRTIAALGRDRAILVQDGSGQADAPGASAAAAASGASARMLAPLMRQGKLVGIISLHHASKSNDDGAHDREALRAAQAEVLKLLEQAESQPYATVDDLRAAAIQVILDRLRIALDVQRCTFRQPVQAAFAFPVAFESRAEGVRSLLGDFTIVQTGQPVIVKLLAERAQVVQDDCSVASTDQLFHKMLAHYGGMGAQVVTPFIVGDELKGVLSVHELRGARRWTAVDKELAAGAADLIGGMFETRR